jgi:hypothetical protein
MGMHTAQDCKPVSFDELSLNLFEQGYSVDEAAEVMRILAMPEPVKPDFANYRRMTRRKRKCSERKSE